MIQKSRISKKLLVTLMGLGLVSTMAACTSPESTSVSESPATTDMPMANTDSSSDGVAQSPLTDGAQNPTASSETLGTLVAESDSFTTLEGAIQAAGLQATLSGSEPYTVFAPTDEAFAELPPEVQDQLLQPENQEQLKQILAYHVVPGTITSADIAPGDVKTVEGQSVTISNENGEVMVGNARVIEPDITASNGVIHAIDKVLLPPDLQIQ